MARRAAASPARDVVEVTGIPVVAVVTASAAVVRAVDAGLLLTGIHRLRELAPSAPSPSSLV